MNEQALRATVEKLVRELAGSVSASAVTSTAAEKTGAAARSAAVEEGCLPDITEVELRGQYLVEKPMDREGFAALKLRTPARLGVGRAGARYKTARGFAFGPTTPRPRTRCFPWWGRTIPPSTAMYR